MADYDRHKTKKVHYRSPPPPPPPPPPLPPPPQRTPRERSPFPAPPTHRTPYVNDIITDDHHLDNCDGDSPVDSLESLQRSHIKTASTSRKSDPTGRNGAPSRRSTLSPSREERTHSVTSFGQEGLHWMFTEEQADLSSWFHRRSACSFKAAEEEKEEGEEEEAGLDQVQDVWGYTGPPEPSQGRCDHHSTTEEDCCDELTSSDPDCQDARDPTTTSGGEESHTTNHGSEHGLHTTSSDYHHHHHHHDHDQRHPHTSPPSTDVVMRSGVWEGVRGVDRQMRVVHRGLKALTEDVKVPGNEDHSGLAAKGRAGSAENGSLGPDARSTDGEEYYDCISPELEKRGPSISKIQPPPCSHQRVLSADHLPHRRCTPTPPPPFPPRPPQTTDRRGLGRSSQRPTAFKDLTTHPEDIRERDEHPSKQQSRQQRQQHHSQSGKEKSVPAQRTERKRESGDSRRDAWADLRLYNTRSLPTLVTRQVAPCGREAWSDSERGSGSSSEGPCGLRQVVSPEGGEEETEGRVRMRMTTCGGQAWDRSWRRLREVVQQTEVLRTLWGSHKTRLQDALSDQERDSGRVRRLEQSVQRGRQVVSALRQQRRQLQQQMEQKEGEMALALRHHKNEAAFLRHKVLAFLEEKKNAVSAEEKCDGRLKAMLETLLSLYLDRERFLALDLAKQNKINELKLLVVRQQLAMEELKEHNAELSQAFSTLMQFLPEQGKTPHPHQPRGSTSPPNPRVGVRVCPGACGRGCRARGMGLSDVLNCERSLYLPGHSTSPELAAVTVYGIGGERNALTSPPEEVFDASRHFCQADGDHNSHHHPHYAAASSASPGMDAEDAQTAEKLLQDLTLHGPGSADFTLADLPP